MVPPLRGNTGIAVLKPQTLVSFIYKFYKLDFDISDFGRKIVKIRYSEMDSSGFLAASRLLLYCGFDHLLILYLLL